MWQNSQNALTDEEIIERIDDYIKKGVKKSDAIKFVSTSVEKTKSEVYNLYEKIFREVIMWEVLLDALIDSAKILPILFLTYLLVEYILHRKKENSMEFVSRNRRKGPLFGALLGIFSSMWFFCRDCRFL